MAKGGETHPFREWWTSLSEEQQKAQAVVEKFCELVGKLNEDRYHRYKEICPDFSDSPLYLELEGILGHPPQEFKGATQSHISSLKMSDRKIAGGDERNITTIDVYNTPSFEGGFVVRLLSSRNNKDTRLFLINKTLINFISLLNAFLESNLIR